MQISSYEVSINRRRITAICVGVIIVVTMAILLSASIKIVEAGNRGVLLHWQQVDGVSCDEKTGVCTVTKPPLNAGIQFVTPFQDEVVDMEVRTQKFEKQSNAASKDLQAVSTTIAVNYHVSPEAANLLYRQVGLDYANRIITPALDETVKQITAKYSANDLITNREQVKLDIEQALGQRLAKFNLMQDVISITNFDFSPQFTEAINAKVTAEQQALTAQNQVAIKEAEARQAQAVASGLKLAAIEQAEGVKQAAILEAEGHAEAIRINAQANQDQIRLLTEFLRNNPDFIEYFRTLQWNGQLPQYLVTSSENLQQLLQIPSKTTKGE